MQLSATGVIVDGSQPVVVAPSSSPITVYQGVDHTITIPIVGSNNKAIPLAGYSAPTLNIRPSPGVNPKTTLTGTIVASSLVFQLTAAQSAALTAGANHWDVFLTNPSGLKDEPIPDSIMTVAQTDA